MVDHIQSVRVKRIGASSGQFGRNDLAAVNRAVAVYLGLAD